jgi:branched-subunit amino acid transport protein
MIVSWQLGASLLGGAVVGTGAFLVIRELLPATPALAPTLARLQPRLEAPIASLDPRLSLGRWGWLARIVPVPTTDLAILGKPVDAYLSSVAMSALSGLIAPGVLVAVLALAGLHVPIFIPVLLGLLCGLLFALLARRDVASKATDARGEFRRAFCTYLDLVVLELTAAGPVQALESAVKICHGWVFDRIGEALTQAQLQMSFPWDQLRVLGEEIDVIELQDFAGIMQSAGDSGAQVQQTLREVADSLRDRLRTDQLGRAETVSAKLEMPAAFLVIVLAIFMIYPLIARLKK